jgi:glycosidase
MNYPLATAIIRFVTGGNGDELCDAVMTLCENYPRKALRLLMNHVGTHDTPRILTSLDGSSDMVMGRFWQSTAKMTPDRLYKAKKLLYLTALLQYTLPGIPSLYYGDEAGVEGYGDPFCRTFFPWGKEDGYLVEFYKKLGLFRRTSKAFSGGDFIPVHTSLGMFSFIRQTENEKVLVCVNRWYEDDYITAPEGFEKAQVVFGFLPDEEGKIKVEALGFTVLKLTV